MCRHSCSAAVPTRVKCKIPCSNLPYLSAVDVLAKQKFKKCLECIKQNFSSVATAKIFSIMLDFSHDYKRFSTTFQVVPTHSQSFSTRRPRGCTNRFGPNTVEWYIGQHRLVDTLAYELPQLFNNVSCVYVQARRND